VVIIKPEKKMTEKRRKSLAMELFFMSGLLERIV
jgi:hypothetical protein